MNFTELALKRESTRSYSTRPVERELIAACAEAARLAPSACNSQPWTFVVVDHPPACEALARETFGPLAPFNKFALQAPVIVALVMEKPNTLSQIGGRIKNKDFYLIDIGIAAEHFCLKAAELGLGTCMLGWFNERRVQKLLNIPVRKRTGLLITMGYPADDHIREKKRKTLDEILKFNIYE